MMKIMIDDRIVVGADGSPGSDAAVAWACEEASRRGGMVIALFVAPVSPQHGSETTDVKTGAEYEFLIAAVERAGGAGVPLEKIVRGGSPVVELEDEAQRQHASLLVVGRRGVSRRPRGSPSAR
jgi:nucleotide-binding universal stress UspA family protein